MLNEFVTNGYLCCLWSSPSSGVSVTEFCRHESDVFSATWEHVLHLSHKGTNRACENCLFALK